MVKGIIPKTDRPKKFDKSKSSVSVAKRNLSKKELDQITKKKKSEKEIKSEKKLQMIQKKKQKEREERRKRFMPNQNQADDEEEKKKNSDDELDEHEGEVFDSSVGILSKDGYYEIPEEHCEITKEDEEIIKRLQKKDDDKKEHKEMTLYDLIMSKMNQNQQKNMVNYNIEELEQGVASTMNKKVVHVYRGVGKVLNLYRSGKFPKAFKVIPLLSNWEDVLFLTKPHQWSSQAMFEATKIFASNFNSQMAQRFYNLVLLPAVRSDIDANKKLRYHYYMAVKKAIFKPNAFFKGFLLPLAKECSSREAAIIGSILVKTSIPVLHASAALLKMSEYDYSIGTSYFIKVLLGKNFALPTKVVDGMVEYFYSFCEEGLEETEQENLNSLPVLWHQSLLIFCQKYKRYLSDEQKKKLKLVMRVRFNKMITPEIRKVLFSVNNNDMAVD